MTHHLLHAALVGMLSLLLGVLVWQAVLVDRTPQPPVTQDEYRPYTPQIRTITIDTPTRVVPETLDSADTMYLLRGLQGEVEIAYPVGTPTREQVLILQFEVEAPLRLWRDKGYRRFLVPFPWRIDETPSIVAVRLHWRYQYRAWVIEATSLMGEEAQPRISPCEDCTPL